MRNHVFLLAPRMTWQEVIALVVAVRIKKILQLCDKPRHILNTMTNVHVATTDLTGSITDTVLNKHDMTESIKQKNAHTHA